VGALGGPVGALAGAGIGAAAGAATGAATTPDQVNLGRPLWNDPEVRVPGRDNARSGTRSGSGMAHARGETRQLQQALNNAGYNAGQADGIYGPRTRQAVMDWQRANNMEATGRPNAQMMSSLNISSTGSDTAYEGRGRGGRPLAERDRAYMGGGMVGTGNDSGMSGSSSGGMTGTGAPGTPRSGGTMGNTGTMGSPGYTGGTGETRGSMGGGTQLRPDPMAPSGRGVPAPSNNPMNDPAGGSGALTPGRNNNQSTSQ
jgi:peptidoglycan hydrolase-like protein with peptidoglycan-binding domain